MNLPACFLFTWPMRAGFGAAALFGATLFSGLSASAIQVKAQPPAWSASGSLSRARFQHTATLLANGKVLAVGGLIGCTPNCNTTNSAEIYDPATGVWSAAGNLRAPLGNHIAVRLLNGKVLVAGGYSTPGVLLSSAELYDPDAGTWSATGNLSLARQFHTAVLLANGKVLVAGGLRFQAGTFVPLNTAELYDPATGTWSLAGTMNSARFFHTATWLANGKVLVVAGYDSNSPDATPLRSAELYDPATGSWTVTGALITARVFSTETLLLNGKVLVAGGGPDDENGLDKAELYDPATGQWSATGSLTIARAGHTATLLPNGKVLIAAGYNGNSLHKSAELYDPVTGSWTATADLSVARVVHSATLLANGRVLVAAGINDPSGASGLASAELFNPGTAAVASVSAASFTPGGAPESIVAAFGSNLAASTQTAPSIPLPTTLADVSLRVRDGAGVERLAPLFFVSPGQINYQIPPSTAAGQGLVNVTSGGSVVAAGVVEITSIAPGLFTANASGQGVAAAVALRIKADGAQSYEPVSRFDSAQNRFVAVPIDLGPATDQVFLVLYGTGIKFRSALSAVSVAVGGANSEVLFADAAPGYVGLDQVNARLSRALAGRGEVDVALSVDGKAANTVRVSVR